MQRTERHETSLRAHHALNCAIERMCIQYGLTRAQRERLLDIAAGRTYEKMSEVHRISMNTVKTEVRQLLRSIGVSCRHEIERAVRSAELRAGEGATAEQIQAFLQLRWE